MCQFKSAIILKDRVFIPDYDSHTDMLEELKIEDTVANAERLFIRAELIPYNNDVFSDIDKWLFVVDQDITPDWYVENYDKQRMIKAVKEWAKSHIHIGVGNLRLDSGSEHYIKDCKNVLICGNATVKYICGNATVNNICDNATVEKTAGRSVISTSPYHRFNNLHKVLLLENSTIKDNYNKVIYQLGDYKLVTVTDGKITQFTKS